MSEQSGKTHEASVQAEVLESLRTALGKIVGRAHVEAAISAGFVSKVRSTDPYSRDAVVLTMGAGRIDLPEKVELEDYTGANKATVPLVFPKENDRDPSFGLATGYTNPEATNPSQRGFTQGDDALKLVQENLASFDFDSSSVEVTVSVPEVVHPQIQS